MDKGTQAVCSPALLAAQEQLLALRSKIEQASARPSPRFQRPDLASLYRGGRRLPSALPEHLGWGSQPLTELLRRGSPRANLRSTPEHNQGPLPRPIDGIETAPYASNDQNRCAQAASEPANERSVRLYPDIALAILRSGLTPVGRIWLLLTHLDTGGRGWLEEAVIRANLGDRKSTLGVCSRRQLRKLLLRGEGIFWTRDRGRLWLRSVAKIAAALGVFHLSYSPIDLPVQVLKESIGQVRAHFYASFHSGRAGSGKQGRPISRAAIEDLCAVSRRTQQLYDKRVGVSRHQNFAIGGRVSKNDYQELAWKHGRSLFPFIDKKGLLGSRGQGFVAWRLPNSYRGPHERRSVGRRKRINRELADLFLKGITGNDKGLDESSRDFPRNRAPIYHKNGTAAATAYNRDPFIDCYWQRRKPVDRRLGNSVGHAGSQFWFFLPGRETF